MYLDYVKSCGDLGIEWFIATFPDKYYVKCNTALVGTLEKFPWTDESFYVPH